MTIRDAAGSLHGTDGKYTLDPKAKGNAAALGADVTLDDAAETPRYEHGDVVPLECGDARVTEVYPGYTNGAPAQRWTVTVPALNTRNRSRFVNLAFTGQPGTKWFTKLSSTDQQTCREAALTRIEDQYGVIIDDGDVSITSLDAASSDPETAVTGQREVAQALEGALGEDSDALGRAAQFVHETRASMLAARSELGDTNVSDLGGYNIAAMSRDVSLTAKRLQRADKEEEAEATRLAMSAVTRARYGLPARTSMEKFIMEHRVRH